jgi:hypothetical protein
MEKLRVIGEDRPVILRPAGNAGVARGARPVGFAPARQSPLSVATVRNPPCQPAKRNHARALPQFLPADTKPATCPAFPAPQGAV